MEREIEATLKRKKDRIMEMHRTDPKRTALLVIDMQQAFTDPLASLHVPDVEKIIPVIAELINFCRGEGIPVIFTEFASDPRIPTLRKDPFGPEHLNPETSGDTGWGVPSGSCVPGSNGPESPATRTRQPSSRNLQHVHFFTRSIQFKDSNS